jgi:hypothetical protein
MNNVNDISAQNDNIMPLKEEDVYEQNINERKMNSIILMEIII